MEITIHDQKKVLKIKKEDFIPKYIDYYGKEIEIKKDGATLQTAVGVTSLKKRLKTSALKHSKILQWSSTTNLQLFIT